MASNAADEAMLDEDFMEDLPPITANRSLSLPTAVLSGIAKLAEPSAAGSGQ